MVIVPIVCAAGRELAGFHSLRMAEGAVNRLVGPLASWLPGITVGVPNVDVYFLNAAFVGRP